MTIERTTEQRTAAANLFAHFAAQLERIRLAGPRRTGPGSGWRTPYKEAGEAVQDGADCLDFGDAYDDVVAQVAAKLDELEQRQAADNARRAV